MSPCVAVTALESRSVDHTPRVFGSRHQSHQCCLSVQSKSPCSSRDWGGVATRPVGGRAECDWRSEAERASSGSSCLVHARRARTPSLSGTGTPVSTPQISAEMCQMPMKIHLGMGKCVKLQTLGKGSFGFVLQARNAVTPEVVASQVCFQRVACRGVRSQTSACVQLCRLQTMGQGLAAALCR